MPREVSAGATSLTLVIFSDQKRSALKIRRILATAVAAAVTTPVVFLSAAPAFADTKPAGAQTQEQKPTIEQLKLAVAAAQSTYDAAVVAHADAEKAFAALADASHPNQTAAVEAKTAADAAAAAKKAADEKLAKAQADLAALPADADKTAAEQAVTDAQAAVTAAAAAKTAADEKLAAAYKTRDDALIEAARKSEAARQAKDKALKELKAAEKALAAAEAEEGEEPGEDCVEESKLTVALTGPKKVVAGTSAVFTLKISNGTTKSLDEVGAYAEAFNMDSTEEKDLDKYLDLSWSTAANPTWQSFDDETGAVAGAVKPGGHADIKLRLTVDAKSPAGDGMLFAAGGYENKNGSCGWSKEAADLEFGITAASKPGTGTGTGGGNGNTTEQGGTSTTPVTGGGNGNTATNGSLATTGSDDAMPQIALAGAAAVALGAGAMFVVRRRKAGSNA
ncbi:LPXTG cell wall anchor domain-containing protein [Streptomyces sp. NPDC053755]|uniref:LPXTG cell wall anchor domain-containing protein n=1 Tax=Streptomyces sp. NPDC053755 TaxID=3155815 RepID=UPI00341E078F